MSSPKNDSSTSKIPQIRDATSSKSGTANNSRPASRQPSAQNLDHLIYKKLTPSRAIFESKKLNSACSFLKQLREKLENDSVVDKCKNRCRQGTISEIIDNLFDVSDTITAIVSAISVEPTPPDQHGSSVCVRRFNNAMAATSKIYEITKKIRQDALRTDSVYYYSKEIIANNVHEISTFKNNLNEIGDRIYVDKELLYQLVELHELLRDTIEKLKQKEKEYQGAAATQSVKQLEDEEQPKVSKASSHVITSRSGYEVPMSQSFFSGDTQITEDETHQSEPKLEEIEVKSGSKEYVRKCIEQLDKIKACLERAVEGDSEVAEQIKLYKENKCLRHPEFHINVDGTPILVKMSAVNRTPQASRSSSRVTDEPDETPSSESKRNRQSLAETEGDLAQTRRRPSVISDPDSNPDLPYTAERRSLPNLDENTICSSLDFDVTTKESSLRETGINHPDAKISRALRQLPIEDLLKCCRPAKCCRKTVLNERSRGRYPYAASLQSLPLIEQDVDKVKEVIQSNVKFFNTYPTFSIFEPYVNFQKHSNDKFVYFWNVPRYEVRFFELFKKDESKTKVAQQAKGDLNATPASDHNTHEIKILEFLRKFYSSEPLPKKSAKKGKEKEPKRKHKKQHKGDKKNEASKEVEAFMAPRPNFVSASASSSSCVSSTLTVRRGEETGYRDSIRSFMLVPRTKVTSFISEEITSTTTYETSAHSFERDDHDDQESTTLESDEHSLSPTSYAKTLGAIYELDENGNVRPKDSPSVPDFQIQEVDHNERPIQEKRILKPPEINLSTIYEIEETKRGETVVEEKCNTFRPESIESVEDSSSDNGQNRELEEVDHARNLETEFSDYAKRREPEFRKKTLDTILYYQREYPLVPKLCLSPRTSEINHAVVPRISLKPRVHREQYVIMPKLSIDSMAKPEISSGSGSSGASTPRCIKSLIPRRIDSTDESVLRLNIDEMIHQLNRKAVKKTYQNIYHVNRTQTIFGKTLGEGQLVPKIPTPTYTNRTRAFYSGALAQAPKIPPGVARVKQQSVQTSCSYIASKRIPIYRRHIHRTSTLKDVPEEIPLEFVRPGTFSKRTSMAGGNIRFYPRVSDELEFHRNNKTAVRTSKRNRSPITSKRRVCGPMKIEKNVVAYVINPKAVKNRNEQTDFKILTHNSEAIGSSSHCKGGSLDRGSKCQTVCEWPPASKQRPEKPRNAFYVSVHGGGKRQEATAPAPIEPLQKLSCASKIVQSYPQQRTVATSDTPEVNNSICQADAHRNCIHCRTGRTLNDTLDRQDYFVGYVGAGLKPDTLGAYREKHHRSKREQRRKSKEKARKRRPKRSPQIVDVSESKNAKNVLKFKPAHGHNRPGFVTVLSTPCNCPDITIFIPCFCGKCKREKSGGSHRSCNVKAKEYKMVPVTAEAS